MDFKQKMKNNILKNKYRILKQIGFSKHGTAYLAQSIDSPDQIVVIKGRRSQGRFSFKPIEMINQNISSKLADFIQKCLELDRIKRPSADEVYNTLLNLNS